MVIISNHNKGLMTVHELNNLSFPLCCCRLGCSLSLLLAPRFRRGGKETGRKRVSEMTISFIQITPNQQQEGDLIPPLRRSCTSCIYQKMLHHIRLKMVQKSLDLSKFTLKPRCHEFDRR